MRVETWRNLGSFKGNKLSIEEKWYRLTRLQSLIKLGMDNQPDKEFISYLERFNSFWFMMTTQCCSGHSGFPNRKASPLIDFRSALSVEDTIDKIIRPFEDLQHPPSMSIQLHAESGRLRFVLWLNKDKWKDQIEQLIEICEKVEREI